MPRVDPSVLRSGMATLRGWIKKVERIVSEEAVKEQAKEAIKEAATETVKETAKEALNSRGEKKTEKSEGAEKMTEKSELDVIKLKLSIKQGDEEEPPKASPETDRLAEEINALKEFVASVLAETTASATANHLAEGRILGSLTLVVLVGGAVAVLVGGGYMLHRRRRGTAAAEARHAGNRGRAAQPAAPLGLHALLHGGGPARRRVDAALAASRPIIAAAHPAPPSLLFAEKCMHKNRLQSFAERTYKKQPIYNVEFEGESHQPKFRCTVEVGGKQFSSAGSFDRKKEAEQDAARVAYEILATVGEDDIKEAVGLIDQDAVFCKSILYEFVVKTKTTWPSYCVVCLIKPLTLFAATVVFDGNSYTGESAPNKKDAEQNAARAVIKSILAKHNTCMVGIVRSKKQLITAVRSSGSTPATFICPVSYAAYGRPDHVAPMLQNASSSLAVQGGIRAVRLYLQLGHLPTNHRKCKWFKEAQGHI